MNMRQTSTVDTGRTLILLFRGETVSFTPTRRGSKRLRLGPSITGPAMALQDGAKGGQATYEEAVSHVRPQREDPPLRGISSSYSSSLPSSSSSSSSSASNSSADFTRGYEAPLSHSTLSVDQSQGESGASEGGFVA